MAPFGELGGQCGFSYRGREPREFDVDPYQRTSALGAAAVSVNSRSTRSARLQQVRDPRTCRRFDGLRLLGQPGNHDTACSDSSLR